MNNVLLVDSDSEIGKLYQIALKGSCKLYSCTTIEAAHELIKQHDFKVVIADAVQVCASSIDFLQELYTNKPNIQRILITLPTAYHLIGEAINKCQIFHYLSKPIDPKKFAMVVQKAIHQYDLNTDNEILLKELKVKNKELRKAIKEVKTEEEKFRNIFNLSPDPIFITECNGIVIDSNKKAKSLFKQKETKLNPFSLYSLLKLSEHKAFVQYLSDISDGSDNMIELMLETKKGSWVQYEINSLPIKYKGKEAYMLTCRDLSERKAMEKRILQSIIKTEENERLRFSQELHDGIGPLLSTTKLYLQWFNRPDAKIEKAIVISKMEETLNETIKSVREISNNISPNTLQNFGLNTALKTFIARIEQASTINFHYTNKVERKLPLDIEVTLYRLICECINNAIKHAEANQILIKIIDENDNIKANINDDGLGFDANKISNSNTGNGLLNMKSRILSLGGNFELITSKGNGTQIHLEFNCPA